MNNSGKWIGVVDGELRLSWPPGENGERRDVLALVKRYHTVDCLVRRERRERERRLYLASWRHTYCQKCGGAGIVTWVENGAPHGEGFWPMDMSEPCEACLGFGKCPRCGHEHGEESAFVENDEPCERCGWTSRDGGLPEPSECYCWAAADKPLDEVLEEVDLGPHEPAE